MIVDPLRFPYNTLLLTGKTSYYPLAWACETVCETVTLSFAVGEPGGIMTDTACLKMSQNVENVDLLFSFVFLLFLGRLGRVG